VDLGAVLIAELLLLGAVVGFLAGLLGIGGGMMLVPFMTFLLAQRGVEASLAVKMAIATSGATILFTSLSSLSAHHRHGMVRWPLVARLAPGIVIGGLAAGAGAVAMLKGQALALVFAGFNVVIAVRMIRGGDTQAKRPLPGRRGLFGAGAGIGFVSGLLGAGGAFLSVPFMTWCSVPLREAVGTSAALGFPIAVAATTGYVIGGWNLPVDLPGSFGYLYLPGIVTVSLASVILAPVGARVAQRTPVRRLRRLFGMLLFTLAGYMAWKALGS
jgi:uncharacterized membrane protein YfcA